ncbi:MAG: hypothetical protein ACKVZJ_03605 [Phycisphaerales bacterium]
MAQSVCIVRSDLSHLRRFGPGGGGGAAGGTAASWTATPIPENERDNIRPLLERVRAAAGWCASGPGRRRLDRVVIDVDESVCSMVRTPSTARPVLAASVRSSSQDWGDLAPVSGLEPLIDPPAKPQKKKRDADVGPAAAESEGVSVAVISQTDALTRLWLDALDGRGVRAGDVCSLWHAAAQAWGAFGAGASGNEVSLILLCESERIVWAMARGADLLCGGSAAISTPATPSQTTDEGGAAVPTPVPSDPLALTVRRCGLDWLSWCGQFGFTADRVVIVGPRAGAVAELLPPAWRRGTGGGGASGGSASGGGASGGGASGGHAPNIDLHVDADPVGLTCTRLAQRPAEAGRPLARRSLVRLAARPTRATRWRYGWAAASLVIFGLGLGGLGYRLAKAGNDVRASSLQVREQIITRAQTVLPNVGPNTNVVWDLEAVVAKLRGAPPFAAPTPPPKIFDELARVSETLAKFPGAKIKSVSLAGDGGRLTCSVTDRESNERLITALKEGGLMEWVAPRDQSNDFTTLSLNGAWRK